jgi:hypothetical protein
MVPRAGMNDVFTAGYETESTKHKSGLNSDKSALLSDGTPDYFPRVLFKTLDFNLIMTPRRG